MKTQHTKGPWHLIKKDVGFSICSKTSEIYDQVATSLCEPNANLIAAAPDMLALLIKIRTEALVNADACDHELLSEIETVLTKATKANP